MKYIITGGAGFIGSHLAEKLAEMGETVLVIDDLSTGSLENLPGIETNSCISVVVNNASDNDFWKTNLHRKDVIIHLGATVGVTKVCEDPLQTIKNNYKSTEVILQMAMERKCKVLFASTSEIYGDSGNDLLATVDIGYSQFQYKKQTTGAKRLCRAGC